MVSRRRIERGEATSEKVELLFYKVIKKSGKKMMKPLQFKTKVPLAMVRAVLDNTIVMTFYNRLADDLRSRGVKEGTTVQLRARFSALHAEIHPDFHGTKILCEVTV